MKSAPWFLFLVFLPGMIWASTPPKIAVDDTMSLFHEEYNSHGVPCAPECINDGTLYSDLTRRMAEMIKNGEVAKGADLLKQFDRRKTKAKLEKTNSAKMSPEDIYTKYMTNVLMVARRYKENNQMMTSAASGFILTNTGIAVTNYHVAHKEDLEAIACMGGDGKTYGVKEILAADQDNDITLLQLTGKNFKGIPLRADAPVGTTVYCFSHPASRYFSLTDGIVSRYFKRKQGKTDITMMCITADYAKGSSGGPIFDDKGNVVGMVRETMSLYADVKGDVKNNLQMVLKQTVTAQAILDLIDTGK